ncbi:MAG: helix-turn-helix transcriptional regulator [Immundisolibacter sp.]|uniref:helix-turn-helix transcriptional regulator n=1 Tax=Immundisolibacter sp. TaxID=1934948 RepID=UPI003EDFB5BA
MVTVAPLGPTAQSLTADYGLTRAEAEVALLLAQGLKAQQIAARRGASVATVNTQIKHIYAKAEADGHAGLLVKLLGR